MWVFWNWRPTMISLEGFVYLQVWLWSKCQYLQVDVIKLFKTLPSCSPQWYGRSQPIGVKPAKIKGEMSQPSLLQTPIPRWSFFFCLYNWELFLTPRLLVFVETQEEERDSRADLFWFFFSFQEGLWLQLFSPGAVGQDGHRRVSREGRSVPGGSPPQCGGEWAAGRQREGRPHGEGTESVPGWERALAKI